MNMVEFCQTFFTHERKQYKKFKKLDYDGEDRAEITVKDYGLRWFVEYMAKDLDCQFFILDTSGVFEVRGKKAYIVKDCFDYLIPKVNAKINDYVESDEALDWEEFKRERKNDYFYDKGAYKDCRRNHKFICKKCEGIYACYRGYVGDDVIKSRLLMGVVQYITGRWKTSIEEQPKIEVKKKQKTLF